MAIHVGHEGSERYFSNQRTRPYDTRDRPPGLRPTEGFYLDLANWARKGSKPPDSGYVGSAGDDVSAYTERRQIAVEGKAGVRLTYWLLFGMNEPRGSNGKILRSRVHEGDWERIDVSLIKGEGDRDYLPHSVAMSRDGRMVEVPWDEVQLSRSRALLATHPNVQAARGSHDLRPTTNAVTACTGCRAWSTYKNFLDAPSQPWYGFGGAWGDMGVDSLTTGPVGPHRVWSKDLY